MGALLAVPRGLVAAAEVLIAILFVGGTFALVEALGTLGRGAQLIARRFHGRGIWALPILALVFGTFGALENMQEEIIPLIPVLLLLGRGIGVDAVSVVAMSAGAAMVPALLAKLSLPIWPGRSKCALRTRHRRCSFVQAKDRPKAVSVF